MRGCERLILKHPSGYGTAACWGEGDLADLKRGLRQMAGHPRACAALVGRLNPYGRDHHQKKQSPEQVITALPIGR